MTKLTTRPLVVVSVLASLSSLVAACGGGPAASGVASLGSGKTTSTTSLSAPAATTPSGGGALSSGGGGSPSSGGSMTIAGGNYSQMLKFSECVRAHGVPNFPDPSPNGTIQFNGVGPGSPQFQAAQNACQKFLPAGKPSPAQQAKALAQALRMSQCMRAHGITDFPDPQAMPGGGIAIRLKATPGSDLNPNNPLFQAAQKTCQSITGFGPPSAQKAG